MRDHRLTVLERMRLRFKLVQKPSSSHESSKPVRVTHGTALNEVMIHRGEDPRVATLDISTDGRFFTTAIADGYDYTAHWRSMGSCLKVCWTDWAA